MSLLPLAWTPALPEIPSLPAIDIAVSSEDWQSLFLNERCNFPFKKGLGEGLLRRGCDLNVIH